MKNFLSFFLLWCSFEGSLYAAGRVKSGRCPMFRCRVPVHLPSHCRRVRQVVIYNGIRCKACPKVECNKSQGFRQTDDIPKDAIIKTRIRQIVAALMKKYRYIPPHTIRKIIKSVVESRDNLRSSGKSGNKIPVRNSKFDYDSSDSSTNQDLSREDNRDDSSSKDNSDQNKSRDSSLQSSNESKKSGESSDDVSDDNHYSSSHGSDERRSSSKSSRGKDSSSIDSNENRSSEEYNTSHESDELSNDSSRSGSDESSRDSGDQASRQAISGSVESAEYGSYDGSAQHRSSSDSKERHSMYNSHETDYPYPYNRYRD